MPDFFRDIFLAFVRIHLLYHAAEGPIYGLEMIEELARHGYTLSPGTLYPILQNLESGGYLISYKQVINGKVRKYYRITDLGRSTLKQLRVQIRELVDEVLGPEGSPVPARLTEGDEIE
ncbi:MAG TPA: PadR family transcriptional regulator [Chthonomonadaceae bacterium]|nr:PadR family transcriptional regulator [Chthonomonadaceae bacterium]